MLRGLSGDLGVTRDAAAEPTVTTQRRGSTGGIDSDVCLLHRSLAAQVENEKALYLMHQNIQSLKNKTLDVEMVVGELTSKPKVLCFTEHWCTVEELQCLRIDGYRLVASYTRSVGTHGGSCVFVTDDLENKVECYDLRQDCEDFNFECACAVDGVNRTVIVTVYRSPTGDTDKFLERLNKIIDNINKKFIRHKKIICGDFNICLLKESQLANRFRDILRQNNFTQTITKPTRVTKKCASLIDNIFINYDDSLQGVILYTALSDHYGQAIELSPRDEIRGCAVDSKFVRVFSNSKLDQFADEISRFSWNNVCCENDANAAYGLFLSRILGLVQIVFPPKRITTQNGRGSWLTRGIRISSKNKRKLYILRNRGQVSDEFYKGYCSVLKKVVISAKRMSSERYLSNAKDKGKAIWSLINQYTGKNKKEKGSILENIKTDGIESAEAVLNSVNDYFINACPEITDGNDLSGICYNQNSLFLQPVVEEEVISVIKSLKNTSSVGDDEIPTKLIKHIARYIAEPLCHIINTSFLTGTFPTELKWAKVKPIFKKGDRSNVSNYRPIAILNNLSKIIEKIIASRILTFFDRENILNNNQNGFRKGRSTIRSVYVALTDILHSMNEKNNTVALCLDLSKAFDSVEHNILLRKLEKYGVRGIALSLVASYLSDRKQYVAETTEAGHCIKSNILEIKRGVPQGSILGPLLYIIYTNDLPLVISERVLQFADDTSVVISTKGEGNLTDLVSERVGATLGTLDHWFKKNNLLLNVNKTQMIDFSFGQSKDRLSIAYNDNTHITSVDQINFLGIGIDSRLDWSYHIDRVVSRVGGFAYALTMISRLISVRASLVAYYAHVQSRLSYGVIFWGHSRESIRVFRLQKRCIRNMFQLHYQESCKIHFIQRGILTLPGIYIYECVLFVKRNMDLFTNVAHSHDTRNRQDLSCGRYNFSYLQKNVEFMTNKIFNKVPIELRSLPTAGLKVSLHRILVKKAYYDLEEFFSDRDFKL